MKILLYTDPHWSQFSSIVRRNGNYYSARLENLIKSVSWAEKLSETQGCEQVICLGDFFDKPFLNSEESTALQEVKWNLSLPHYFLVGNHESSIASLIYSTTKVLEAFGFNVVSTPSALDNLSEKTGIVFIPYTMEEHRKPIEEYLSLSKRNKKVVLSHNDIKGLNYGAYTSQEGFELSEIDKKCDLYINGHLHNSCFLNDKETILNLGNLTGQNFLEDAYRYGHYACVLDTETLQLDFFENPHAFNFYKIEISSAEDLAKLAKLKTNAVVTFSCKEEYVSALREQIEATQNIVDSRVVVYRDTVSVSADGVVSEITLSGLDYLKKFSEFILATLGADEVVKKELEHINKGGN